MINGRLSCSCSELLGETHSYNGLTQAGAYRYERNQCLSCLSPHLHTTSLTAKCCMCCSDSTRSFELAPVNGAGSDSDPFLVGEEDNDNTSMGDDRCVS